MDNLKVIPVQQLCLLCDTELEARGTTTGLLARLCPLCVRLVSEQVFMRELEQRPKVIRV
jgi:hypothetical protein